MSSSDTAGSVRFSFSNTYRHVNYVRFWFSFSNTAGLVISVQFSFSNTQACDLRAVRGQQHIQAGL